METALRVLLALLFLALVVFGIWAHFEGPCSIWAYSKAAEVPYRCLRGGA